MPTAATNKSPPYEQPTRRILRFAVVEAATSNRGAYSLVACHKRRFVTSPLSRARRLIKSRRYNFRKQFSKSDSQLPTVSTNFDIAEV